MVHKCGPDNFLVPFRAYGGTNEVIFADFFDFKAHGGETWKMVGEMTKGESVFIRAGTDELLVRYH